MNLVLKNGKTSKNLSTISISMSIDVLAISRSLEVLVIGYLEIISPMYHKNKKNCN